MLRSSLTIQVPLDLTWHFETGWFSADGHLYAAGGQNKAVRMWNLASGAFTTVATTDANVLTTCAAPDDSSFTVGAADGALKLCALTPQVRDGASATVLWEVNLARSEVCGTAFSRCGTWIAAVADDDSLQILEASSGAKASQKQLQADVDQIKTLLGQLFEQGR